MVSEPYAQKPGSDSVVISATSVSTTTIESDALLTPAASKVEEHDEKADSKPEHKSTEPLKKLLTLVLEARPLLGVLAICLSVCCSFFALAILLASDNKPTVSWAVQPTVYLAIAAAIANSAISFAYAQATVVSWWLRATKGASIRTLERQWEASDSLLHALLQCRHMSLPAVAGVLVSSMIIDGVLLQRAASVRVATQSELVKVNVTLAPEIPTGFTGISQYNNIITSQGVLQICQEWEKQTPIALVLDPPCQGRCSGKVRAPGIALASGTCDTTTWPISSEMYHDPNATWGPWSGEIQNSANSSSPNNPIFSISLSMSGINSSQTSSYYTNQGEAAWIGTGQIAVFNASGKYTDAGCFWVPAILEYDVVFDNDGTVDILPDPESPGQVVALANNTHVAEIWNTGAPHLETITFLISYLLAYVNVNASAAAPVPDALDSASSVWYQDAGTYNSQAYKYENYSNGPLDDNFFDPTLDIVHSLNEMMFRSAVMASGWANTTSLMDPGLSVDQRTVVNQTVTHNVFHSDFRWYAGATVLELIVALSVLPMLWGWWTLDRRRDFSPLSFGLAFDAPLLGAADPSKGAEGVMEELGDMLVRFDKRIQEEKAKTSPSSHEKPDDPAQMV